jgi:hypothetical protein
VPADCTLRTVHMRRRLTKMGVFGTGSGEPDDYNS